MQLVHFSVLESNKEIRAIKFKSGVNIITNSSPNGNQIGKSTALRAINFCLGSDGKSMWEDPDTRKINTKIEQWATSGKVEFILRINSNNRIYTIKRKIDKIEQKRRSISKITSWINDHQYSTNEAFQAGLAPILGLSTENPPYSAIKNRFVRLDKSTSGKLYKYLNIHTLPEKYIPYYSYIFSFEGHNALSKEFELREIKKEKETRIRFLLNGEKEITLANQVKSIELEIEELRNSEKIFDFKGPQTRAIEKLNATRTKIAKISSEIATLDIKINYSLRTIDNYKNNRPNLDTELIARIYSEAKAIIPNLKKELNDLIYFHESVYSTRIEYIEKQIHEAQEELAKKSRSLDDHLTEERDLIKHISNESNLSGFLLIEKELQEKMEMKGKKEAVLEEVKKENKAIKNLEKDMEILRNSYEYHLKQLDGNLDILNSALKRFTKQLFKFSLSINFSPDSKRNELTFSVINEEKIDGDGAPRAAALAFDMALVWFATKSSADLPKFTLQDYLESADEEKLAKLCRIANKEKIQVVMAVLQDKIISLGPVFLKKNVVLWLDQHDKFFKRDT